jgi:hypothetical protein
LSKKGRRSYDAQNFSLGNYRVRRGLLLVLLFNGHSANLKLGRLTIVAVTAPASLIDRAMPLAYYWFILLNAAFYPLAGLTAELLRPSVIRHRSS